MGGRDAPVPVMTGHPVRLDPSRTGTQSDWTGAYLTGGKLLRRMGQ